MIITPRMNGYKVITSISDSCTYSLACAWLYYVGLLKHIYVVYAILCMTMLCRSRYMSFADYQDILTLWTSVLHNLLSECGNVGLFMVGLTRFDCILFILTVFILLFIFTILSIFFFIFTIFNLLTIFNLRGVNPCGHP